MKIRSITFKAPEPKLKVIKSVTVYISEKHSQIIIAPFFKEPKESYIYEQGECEVIDFNSPIEAIGEAIKRNFDKFDIKEREPKKINKSDWAAYKASKEKSIRGFEEKYMRISIRGLSDLNNTLIIETVLNLPVEIELVSRISAHCKPSKLGSRILKMFHSEITERK